MWSSLCEGQTRLEPLEKRRKTPNINTLFDAVLFFIAQRYICSMAEVSGTVQNTREKLIFMLSYFLSNVLNVPLRSCYEPYKECFIKNVRYLEHKAAHKCKIFIFLLANFPIIPHKGKEAYAVDAYIKLASEIRYIENYANLKNYQPSLSGFQLSPRIEKTTGCDLWTHKNST